MKASELRRGNYVQDIVSGEWMVVDELGENIGATLINRDKFPLADGWQMGPISLTPEILEKAGFKVDDKYEDVTVFDYVKNNECTAVLKSGTLTNFNIVFEDKNCKDEDFRWSDWHSLPVNYKYLHQLQNLYFALTGEELNIDL